MTLQARLTLWSVLFITAIVAAISAVDLANDMQHQFDATLERAVVLRRVTTTLVQWTLEKDRTMARRQALRDPMFNTELANILAASRGVLEIAVCDRTDEILADSDPGRRGQVSPPYEDFARIVERTNWLDKIRVLYGNKNYQLEQALGAGQEIELYVRIIVDSSLIQHEVRVAMQQSANIAIISIVGAVIVSLLFSSIAFRPLGQIGKMLDVVASGEYDQNLAPAPPRPQDEFGVMASKVNMLGQQLRGAHYDFSDLRGNFEKLIDDLEDAVLMFGRDRKLVLASGEVEKFLGRRREDLVDQTLSDIFPPNTSIGLLLAQAAQTGRPIRNRRVPIERTGDGLALVVVSVDMPDGAGPGSATPGGMLVRMRDPEATRQIGRQLQTADRLSAISKITGGVAHEVKNPLNAIQMHVQLAKMKLERNDYDIGQQMDIISSEILRLDRVVKTFLDFTRPVELKLTEVAVEPFLNEVADLARPQAAANQIEMEVSQETDGARVRVDVDLLKQAMLNIVVNAIQAMPNGGRLSIASRLEDEEVAIHISDTGGGIPPELREKIFRLYFTTKKEGSGIGLAMTYRIVQLHDGTIDFTSEPGQGTTFMVRLPVAL